MVTVIRNGPEPRTDVKILLNRRSVQSYEQLMKDISDALGPKWRNDKVQKLFTTRGREVKGVSDFFRDDEVFIAVGSESLTMNDVQAILEELYPDSSYPRSLMKDWEKARRRYQQQPVYKMKDPDDEFKKDSGLGSDGSKEDGEKDEVIYSSRQGDDYRPKKVKRPHYSQPKTDSYSAEEEDMSSRIERERVRAAEEERERARKRMQKRLDAERRIMEEERRKRGLVPLRPAEDPFRRSPERPKQNVSPSPERRKPRPKRSDSDDEPKVIVVVKGDGEENNGGAGDAGKSPREKQTDDDEDRRRKAKPSPDRYKSPERHKPKDRGSDLSDKSTDENANKLNRSPSRKPKDDKENDDPGKKKKSRPKSIIHKSKVERQISNADHVLNRYQLGKVLGDGNFAVVKQSKLKANNHDYAMKVIDKAKLKGKDQMVENEIAIMKMCQHPNIVKLYEEFETKNEIYLVMELVKVRWLSLRVFIGF